MRRMMDKVLRRYGIEAQVERDDIREAVRIFFQPSTSKSWQNMEPVMGPLGRVPGGQFLYIGPAGTEIRPGDRVTVAGKGYILRRAEAVLDKNGPVYRWGLCVEKGGEDTWGC